MERPRPLSGDRGRSNSRILIDHARKRHAVKRRAPPRSAIEIACDLAECTELDVLCLDEALQRLADRSARQARVVELRFFGGMSVEEVAEVLSVSANSVKGDWRVARAWLQDELDPDELA